MFCWFFESSVFKICISPRFLLLFSAFFIISFSCFSCTLGSFLFIFEEEKNPAKKFLILLLFLTRYLISVTWTSFLISI